MQHGLSRERCSVRDNPKNIQLDSDNAVLDLNILSRLMFAWFETQSRRELVIAYLRYIWRFIHIDVSDIASSSRGGIGTREALGLGATPLFQLYLPV